MHQATKFQQNRTVRGWVIDYSTHFPANISGSEFVRRCSQIWVDL